MTEHSQETKVAILEAKVEHMVGHVTELTKRVSAVEKVCAIVSAVGIAGGGIVGTTVFNAPKADAFEIESQQPYPGMLPDNSNNANLWIQQMKNWKSEQERQPIEDMLNNALVDLEWTEDGSDDPAEQKELLQLSSNFDRQSFGWGHDRCNNRSWFRFIQKRKSEDSRC